MQPDLSAHSLAAIAAQTLAALASCAPVSVIGDDGAPLEARPSRLRDGAVTVLLVDVAVQAAASGAAQTTFERASREAVARQTQLAELNHELRNPLNGLLGMAQALLERDLPAETRAMAETLRRSAAAMADLLGAAIERAGAMQAHDGVDVGLHDPHPLLRDAVALWGPSARARGGSLTLEIDPAVPDRLWFDPIQIRQCLDNLIQNAISHAPGGAIATRAHARRLRGESWVLVIAVADQGPGVPAPLREQIFAPYVRGPARADAQGSGLGLAVVRRIARRHGGEVTLSHPAEGGACFEVAIRAAPPIRPHRNGQPVRRGAGASRARVLIVDDDPINRAVTVHMLASLDLALEEAATGAEALAAAHARAPDLVLLDVHLEDMDGEAVLAALRALPAPPHVVLVTGDPRIGALIGARATLLKPLDIAQLRHEVCAALDVGAPG